MDTVSPQRRSEIMAWVRAKDTGPEMAVRRLVHGMGYRYRLHRRALPGTPDLVFVGRRKVIFVHGCFWHRHSGCAAARVPKARHEFWLAKLQGNSERDFRNVRALRKQSWGVMIVWECELKDMARLRARIGDFSMRSIELFAGAGGLGMGLAAAGFEPEMVVEWDSHSCRTLRDNKARRVQQVTDWNIVESDARKVKYDAIRGEIALVSGGPPCQPFSIGGKHKGQADERNMWPEAARAVRELAPRAFMFENVRGLMRAAFEPYLSYVLLQLRLPEIAPCEGELWEDHAERLRVVGDYPDAAPQGLTYRVSIHPVDAADYGAPQKRRRVIIVGFREDEPAQWVPPEPTHSQEALLWDQWVSGEYWTRHAISDRKRPEMPKSVAKAVERLRTAGHRPRTEAWQTVRDAISDLGEPAKVKAKVVNHMHQPGARSYAGHTGSLIDNPAKALKAGAHGVPGGENMLAYADGSVRYFSVREAARLQGFPDEYEFPATVAWGETMRQLGNAVPTQLAEAFGSSIAGALRAGQRARRRAA